MGLFLQVAIMPGCKKAEARTAVEEVAKKYSCSFDELESGDFTEEDLIISELIPDECQYAETAAGVSILFNDDCIGYDALAKASVIVDDGWYSYWSERCENPLDDAETLLFDEESFLVEIGQKTTDLSRVQSQYIGLMRFQGNGVKAVLALAEEAEERSRKGMPLWRTSRTYRKMYMTDLLQGLIDEGSKLKAVHIDRGWFEIDDCEDLKVVERQLL